MAAFSSNVTLQMSSEWRSRMFQCDTNWSPTPLLHKSTERAARYSHVAIEICVGYTASPPNPTHALLMGWPASMPSISAKAEQVFVLLQTPNL